MASDAAGNGLMPDARKERELRLAQALRANLARRKAQARQRRVDGQPQGEAGGDGVQPVVPVAEAPSPPE